MILAIWVCVYECYLTLVHIASTVNLILDVFIIIQLLIYVIIITITIIIIIIVIIIIIIIIVIIIYVVLIFFSSTLLSLMLLILKCTYKLRDLFSCVSYSIRSFPGFL